MQSGHLLLLAGALGLSGCVVESAGPLRHDFQSIDRDKSESVQVHLNMGAGNLQVGSGTSKLMTADFAYNVETWKPEVKYHGGSGVASLTVDQPTRGQKHFGNPKYDWDLRFARDVPLDMDVHFGAGEARLDLGGLNMRSIVVDMGVGKLQMDLRGSPKHDYNVQIRGGVGEATVRLPSDIGVIAEAEGGIGEIQARGLRRDGKTFTNDAYSNSKVKIRLDVRGGIGAIRLISE